MYQRRLCASHRDADIYRSGLLRSEFSKKNLSGTRDGTGLVYDLAVSIHAAFDGFTFLHAFEPMNRYHFGMSTGCQPRGFVKRIQSHH